MVKIYVMPQRIWRKLINKYGKVLCKKCGNPILPFDTVAAAKRKDHTVYYHAWRYERTFVDSSFNKRSKRSKR